MTPQQAAGNFLRSQVHVLGISPDSMQSLDVTAAHAPIGENESLRFESEKRLMDSTAISYTQTMFGLPIYQAGVSVILDHANNGVRAATSTLHYDIVAQRPGPAVTEKIAGAAATGGFDELVRRAIPAADIRINRTRLMVYQYDAPKRTDSHRDTGSGFGRAPPTLPLPPMPASITDGTHYVVVEALFSSPLPDLGMLNWRAFIEPETGAVLYLRALVSGATGYVFDQDPITKTGNLANFPNAVSATLDLQRDNVALVDLGPVAGGQQSLAGTFVILANVAPAIVPPTEADPFSFAYSARTNEFAAANAYYHCDRFFRLVKDSGFDTATYFGGTTFPVPVDHRAPGDIINAQCRGNALGNGIGSLVFQLADTGDVTHPLGIAADWRVVLHELAGHGILWGQVDSPNFGFAHSAGDSVAVILNDTATHAPDRFVSFPWVNIGRRHDRDPAAGWGWGGSIALNPFDPTLDPHGYNNEPILSTTHFRLYRALGGDSVDAQRRRWAAQTVVYLILRAVGQLTPATNPPNALAWEQQLETADQGFWSFRGSDSPQGVYYKVIRWAFEKQGLFRAPGAPPTAEGAPPAVDVYIDDGRHGEYQFQEGYYNCTDVWNRHTVGDGGGAHENPIPNRTNFAYVRIKNRGTQAATNVVVSGYQTSTLYVPERGIWPMAWQDMDTRLNAPDIAAGDNVGVVVGPIPWTPNSGGVHLDMYFSVSATGDFSNLEGLNQTVVRESVLVPTDNNIAQRSTQMDPGRIEA